MGKISHIILLLFLDPFQIFAEIIDTAHDYNELSYFDKFILRNESFQCCGFKSDYFRLFNCMSSLSTTKKSSLVFNSSSYFENRITLISYFTNDIKEYATYSFAINTAYAEIYQFPFLTFSPETGHEYESHDQRWNRVKIIDNAFDLQKGWIAPNNYIIWLDADLAIIDMSLNFQEIIDRYSNYDIIISAERHAETGVANTGCFIIKNTEWSRVFLSDWWNLFDRKTNHDQIFFDKLYKSRLPDITRHVFILPADAINSIPPPMLHQQPHNKILHLMGERNDFRREVFQMGYHEICKGYTNHGKEPTPGMSSGRNSTRSATSFAPQLGLNRETLRKKALQIFGHRLEELFSTKLSLKQRSANDMSVEDVSATRELLIQSRKYFQECDKSSANFKAVDSIGIDCPLSTYLERLQALYLILQSKLDLTPTNQKGQSLMHHLPLPLAQEVEVLQSISVVGNDILQETRNNTLKSILFDEVNMYLMRLLEKVPPVSRVIVEEMLASLHLSSGAFHQSQNRLEAAHQSFSLSVSLLQSQQAVGRGGAGAGAGGNPYRLVQPLQSLALCTCMLGRHSEGLRLFRQVISLQEDLLSAEQQLKEDHIGLAMSLLNAGVCAVDSGEVTLSRRYWGRSRQILLEHPERQRAAAYLPSLELLDRMIAESSSSSSTTPLPSPSPTISSSSSSSAFEVSEVPSPSPPSLQSQPRSSSGCTPPTDTATATIDYKESSRISTTTATTAATTAFSENLSFTSSSTPKIIYRRKKKKATTVDSI